MLNLFFVNYAEQFFCFVFFPRVNFLVVAEGNGWAFGDYVGGRSGHKEFVFVSVGPLRGLVG